MASPGRRPRCSAWFGARARAQDEDELGGDWKTVRSAALSMFRRQRKCVCNEEFFFGLIRWDFLPLESERPIDFVNVCRGAIDHDLFA